MKRSRVSFGLVNPGYPASEGMSKKGETYCVMITEHLARDSIDVPEGGERLKLYDG